MSMVDTQGGRWTFTSENVRNTLDDRADYHWYNLSRLFEYYGIKSVIELNKLYLELHQSLYTFFKSQQDRWGKRTTSTCSTLIVYQVVAYQQWRTAMGEYLENTLLVLSMIPIMLKVRRNIVNTWVNEISSWLDDSPDMNPFDMFYDQLKELQDRLLDIFEDHLMALVTLPDIYTGLSIILKGIKNLYP